MSPSLHFHIFRLLPNASFVALAWLHWHGFVFPLRVFIQHFYFWSNIMFPVWIRYLLSLLLSIKYSAAKWKLTAYLLKRGTSQNDPNDPKQAPPSWESRVNWLKYLRFYNRGKRWSAWHFKDYKKWIISEILVCFFRTVYSLPWASCVCSRVVLVIVISQLRACLYEVSRLARLARLTRLMPSILLKFRCVYVEFTLDLFWLRTLYPG